jgi:hypothetical protein
MPHIQRSLFGDRYKMILPLFGMQFFSTFFDINPLAMVQTKQFSCPL